jgi:hypothetical protein
MRRIIVCSATLFALVAFLRWQLNRTFENWGFGWGATACIGVMLSCFFIAYLFDRADTRSREEQLRARRDFQ